MLFPAMAIKISISMLVSCHGFTIAYHLITIASKKGHGVTSWKACTTPHCQGFVLSPFWQDLLDIVSVPNDVMTSTYFPNNWPFTRRIYQKQLTYVYLLFSLLLSAVVIIIVITIIVIFVL